MSVFCDARRSVTTCALYHCTLQTAGRPLQRVGRDKGRLRHLMSSLNLFYISFRNIEGKCLKILCPFQNESFAPQFCCYLDHQFSRSDIRTNVWQRLLLQICLFSPFLGWDLWKWMCSMNYFLLNFTQILNLQSIIL